MPHFFVILLKINLVLVLFAAAYYLVLRRLTFYTINRVFLIFGILFSSIYPFINLTDFFHRQKQISQEVVAFVPRLNQQVNALVPSNFINEYWQAISFLFYLGVGLMALRLGIQFISLYRMHKKSAPGAIADYRVRILNEPVSPFSFWQTVYINPTLHQEKELATILAHEQIHVTQWHSLDIILAELSVVFYWFNPGVWMMKKAVKENLEFITDQKILNKGIDKKSYQYSLLDVGNLTPAVAIVNNFNLSDLKKRIKMMNVKRSSRLTLSRYLLITPLLLITTLAFTVSKKELNKHFLPFQKVIKTTNALVQEVALPFRSPEKISAKNRRITPAVSQVKLDTASRFTILVQSLFGTTDTGEVTPVKLAEADQQLLISNAGTPTKDLVTKQVFFYKTDSLKNPDQSTKVKRIQLRFKEGVNLPEHLEKDNLIIVRGVPLAGKPLDSLTKRTNAVYIVNGKKLTREEFEKLVKPDYIKDLTVSGLRTEAPVINVTVKN